MYNPEPITKDEHLCFIESLLNNKEKKYFIVKFDNQKIGVVDFTKIVPKKSLYMGIYVNPETKVKGCGSILLSEIIKYSFENLSVKKNLCRGFFQIIKELLNYIISMDLIHLQLKL